MLKLVSTTTMTPEQNRLTVVATPVEGGSNNGINSGQPGNHTWTSLFPVDGLILTNAESNEKNGENVKIAFNDIKLEVEYWTNVVLYRVLGENPPVQVMEGFIRRVWGKLGIDKIALVTRGIFIVRFNSFENISKVLAHGLPMFNKKLIIVQPWSANVDMKKIDTSKVPVWVRLLDLDFKYWGQSTLIKLAGTLGKPIKTDRATSMKELLSYARVLIEMSIDEEFLEYISFENEWGAIDYILLNYELKPIKSPKCGMFGHESEDCKKGQPRRAWRPRVPVDRQIGN